LLRLAVCSALAITILQLQFPRFLVAQTLPPQIEAALPPSQIHPLPPGLRDWQDSENQGDYFAAVRPTQFGYLIWSQFPIQVYVEPPTGVVSDRSQAWFDAVMQAIAEWNAYLPLTVFDAVEGADITIWRRTPPSETSGNTVRARSAETRYELYVDRSAAVGAILSHRFSILLRPSQTSQYIQAAARHELGHALGIWGHSPRETDALYFSQVRTPAPISPRDVNTLKRIYEQPTRLGWILRNCFFLDRPPG
jgi:predicted Zn-dependent protease